jgi:enamine deaminase RidA (YjgF/YER057c/UK114 family)
MTDIEYKALLPEGWPRPRGYAHAVLATGSKILRIAGQLPLVDGEGPVKEGLDIGAQWEISLSNVITHVKNAGGDIGNIVSLRVFVTDMDEFRQSGAAIGTAWKNTLGRHFPAMTLVEVSGLVDENAKVEIECEAVIG